MCQNRGMTHVFPDDLVQAQRDWYATYRRLAAAGSAPTDRTTDQATDQATAQTTVLRRRLVRLSVRIAAHPFWTTLPGTAPAARMELKAMTWTDPA